MSRPAMAFALVFLALCSQGCAAKQPEQERETVCAAAPDAAIYMCTAQAPDAGGCLGFDSDAGISYPVGCTAIVCSGASILPLSCTCGTLGGRPPFWGCQD